MTTQVQCAQIHALDCFPVTVEFSWSKGFTGCHLVGSVGEVCKQGLERSKSALEHLGVSLSNRKMVISLSPAFSSSILLAGLVGLDALISSQFVKRKIPKWLKSSLTYL